MEYTLIICDPAWQEFDKYRNKPGAFLFKDENTEIFSLNGKFHNENGPAYINYWDNGNIEYQAYYINGFLHNINGPADIHFYKNGNVKMKEYYINNKMHNELGPAHIQYDENGNVDYESYYLYDIKIYSKEDYQKQIKTKLYW